MDGLGSYKQKEIYEDTRSTYRSLYQYDQELLRIEIRSGIETSDAQRRIDAQLVQIKSVYEKSRAPYPGEISDTIECNKDFMPVYDTVQAGSLPISRITAYLTDRLTYGACTGEQARYRSMLALLFCPTQNKLYQLEFIAPKNQFDSVSGMYSTSIRSLQCGYRLP